MKDLMVTMCGRRFGKTRMMEKMMKELLLDKKDAALALLEAIAALERGYFGASVELLVPPHLMRRIDLVLDLPDKPGKEPGENS